jgi:hypothetical protein
MSTMQRSDEIEKMQKLFEPIIHLGNSTSCRERRTSTAVKTKTFRRKGMIAMALPLFFADISPLPFIIAGGGILVAICGIILSLAVFVAGIIRRKRNRDKSKLNNK